MRPQHVMRPHDTESVSDWSSVLITTGTICPCIYQLIRFALGEECEHSHALLWRHADTRRPALLHMVSGARHVLKSKIVHTKSAFLLQPWFVPPGSVP
jgi:hypothetical protein